VPGLKAEPFEESMKHAFFHYLFLEVGAQKRPKLFRIYGRRDRHVDEGHDDFFRFEEEARPVAMLRVDEERVDRGEGIQDPLDRHALLVYLDRDDPRLARREHGEGEGADGDDEPEERIAEYDRDYDDGG